jgi:hypothetical protein
MLDHTGYEAIKRLRIPALVDLESDREELTFAAACLGLTMLSYDIAPRFLYDWMADNTLAPTRRFHACRFERTVEDLKLRRIAQLITLRELRLSVIKTSWGLGHGEGVRYRAPEAWMLEAAAWVQAHYEEVNKKKLLVQVL